MTQLSSATDGRLGRAFAEALGLRDFPRAGRLLHPAVDFRALTPRRIWEAASAADAVEVLRTWFAATDIEEVTSIETDAFADRQRVGYRFRGRAANGPFVLEQQVYFSEHDDHIDWMRIMCSGFRPDLTRR
jgi:hypothetical protein